MKTVTIQIGNSDDKLTQQQWCRFCTDVRLAIASRELKTHFSGVSPGDASWQNACWVIEIKESTLEHLRGELAELAGKYRQDSIAVTVGETWFVN